MTQETSGRQILIIEDEPAIADNTRLALELEGFAPTWVSTLGEARHQLQTQKFDFIILDVGLPDGDGFSFCRDLQKSKKYLSIPILFLTARDSEIDRVVGLELGADDYLTKPFSPRELTARVKAILRRVSVLASPALKDSSKSSTLNWGPFVIDEGRQQYFYFKIELKLSRQEAKLLRFFLKHPGQVFNREQLLQKIWDAPETVLDRTVDAHIKGLRAKLKSIQPDIEAIITHRALGYALKEDW